MSRPWTPAEDQLLKEQYGKKHTLAQLAAAIGRGRGGVWARAARLGLTPRQPDKETRETLCRLIALLHGWGWLDTEIAAQWTRFHPTTPVDRRSICDLRQRLQLPSNACNERHRDQIRQRTKAQLDKAGLYSLGELRREAYKKFVCARGWPDYLRPRHAQILDLLYEQGPKTRKEIAAAIGWNLDRGQRNFLSNKYGRGSYLADLTAGGFVTRSRYREVRGRSKGTSVYRYFISTAIVRADPSTWPDKEWARGQIYGKQSKSGSVCHPESAAGGRTDLPSEAASCCRITHSYPAPCRGSKCG